MATCSLTGDKDNSEGLNGSKGASSEILPERRFDDSLEVDEGPEINRVGNFYNFTYNSQAMHPHATNTHTQPFYCSCGICPGPPR